MERTELLPPHPLAAVLAGSVAPEVPRIRLEMAGMDPLASTVAGEAVAVPQPTTLATPALVALVETD